MRKDTLDAKIIAAILDQDFTVTLRNDLKDLLKDILVQLSQYSFAWHPLGFIHLKAGGVGNRDLRIHIWPPHDRRPQEPLWPIHDHIWDLNSYVVLGEITDLTFEAGPSSSSATHRVYHVEYSESFSILQPTEEVVAARLVKRREISANAGYSIPIGTFHSSDVPTDQLTVTAVVATKSTNHAPRVLGEVCNAASHQYERSKCDSRIASSLVKHLISIL